MCAGARNSFIDHFNCVKTTALKQLSRRIISTLSGCDVIAALIQQECLRLVLIIILYIRRPPERRNQ